METETLDKLYLEWAQFTNARTKRELFAIDQANKIMKALHDRRYDRASNFASNIIQVLSEQTHEVT